MSNNYRRKPNQINLIPFDSRRFRYDKSDNTITAEASDLENNHLQRLYDDACDVGLAIKSATTGKVVTYYMTHEEKDREGDTQYWLYEPLPDCIRQVPECAGTKLMVFND